MPHLVIPSSILYCHLQQRLILSPYQPLSAVTSDNISPHHPITLSPAVTFHIASPCHPITLSLLSHLTIFHSITCRLIPQNLTYHPNYHSVLSHLTIPHLITPSLTLCCLLSPLHSFSATEAFYVRREKQDMM